MVAPAGPAACPDPDAPFWSAVAWGPAAGIVFFLVAFAQVCQLLQTLHGLPFSSRTIPGGSFGLGEMLGVVLDDSAGELIVM